MTRCSEYAPIPRHVRPSDVVDDQRDIQLAERLENSRKIVPTLRSIRKEISHIAAAVRFDLLDDLLDLGLVPPVDDQVEPSAKELDCGSFSNALSRPGNDSVRRGAMEVLPNRGWPEKVEP